MCSNVHTVEKSILTPETDNSLNSWNSDDKPRERLKKFGVQSLKDHELLAIMLGSGTKGVNVVDLSQQILRFVDGKLSALSTLTLADLLKNFRGIGEAKAMQILASLELGRRRSIETGSAEIISSSQDIVNIFAPLIADSPNEQFWLLLLNRRNGIIAKQCIAIGGVASVVADPKLIIRPAIERLASSIVLCHNHPSASLAPSREDTLLTQKIKQAAQLFDIRLLDHVIVTPIYSRYYSFADEGVI